jgi:hypothetical protein
MNAVLECFGRVVATERRQNVHPWTPEERVAVLDALSAPRGVDGKGNPIVQMLLAVAGCVKSPHNQADPSRQTVEWIFATDDRIQKLAAVARNGGVDVSPWFVRGGGGPPPTSSASGGEPRTPEQSRQGRPGQVDKPLNKRYDPGDSDEAALADSRERLRELGIEVNDAFGGTTKRGKP